MKRRAGQGGGSGRLQLGVGNGGVQLEQCQESSEGMAGDQAGLGGQGSGAGFDEGTCGSPGGCVPSGAVVNLALRARYRQTMQA